MKPIYAKIIILIIVALLIFGGIWWWTTLTKTKPFNPDNQQHNQKTNISDEKSNDIVKPWAIPVKNENGNSIFEVHQEAKDCVEVVNCATQGRDLISTLITNKEVREQLKCEKYTTNYLTKLKNIITNYTNKHNNSNIFATKVCSLDDDTDVITGYLWPSNDSPLVESGKFAGTMKNGFVNDPAFVVVKNSEVSIFQKGIKQCNSSATGAEVEPCKAELQDGKVLWSCFTGLYNRGEGSNMKYWLFDFNNSTPKVWEDIEYN